MTVTAGTNARMGRATLASVGIHVLVALAIPALAWTESTAPRVETVSFTHIVRVEIKPPKAVQPPPRAVAPRHSSKAIVNFAHHARLVSATPRRHAPSAPAIVSNAPVAPDVAAVPRTGTGNADTNAMPNATPSPAIREVASTGARPQPGGYLPFGAQQPDPVLDPDVRKQLGALGAHVTLIVTVGEDGHTENVTFQPPIDPQLETRIRSLLADASWDPAVCGGGVSCEAQTTIKL
jgi:hypothetical protein